MKNLTNEELSMIVKDLTWYMRMFHDVEMDEYADQYWSRMCDISMHGLFYEHDARIQEEVRDDYIELIRTIHKTIDDYSRSIKKKTYM